VRLYISAISILELQIGIQRMERRDRKQGQVLRSWMDGHVLPAFLGRILAIDAAVAQRCAALLVPDPGSERDALIAAAALGMTVLTLLCLKAEDSCFNLRCWLSARLTRSPQAFSVSGIPRRRFLVPRS
jgi:predicted lysophospholipase L1 biosynthesis ABC-type transport system permease subunit